MRIREATMSDMDARASLVSRTKCKNATGQLR